MRSAIKFFTFTVSTVLSVNAVSATGEVTLVSGDRLIGTIVSSTQEEVTLQHHLLGEIVLPRSEIASVMTDEQEVAETIKQNVTEPDDGLFHTGWLRDWERGVSVGITGTAGKSENQKINAGFVADFEDEQTRLSHETAYYRNESDGSLSDNNLKSLVKRDWLEPGSPWFEFASARFDWDEFQDWEYRLTGNGGIGYEFISTPRFRLLGRTGLGANQTFGDREELTWEGLIEVDMTWRPSSAQTLAFTNIFHPNFEKSGEYRNLITLDWDLDLDEESGLGLRISLSNDYDSLAVDAADKNDFKYTGALVWKL